MELDITKSDENSELRNEENRSLSNWINNPYIKTEYFSFYIRQPILLVID